jgi:hypothetical protein
MALRVYQELEVDERFCSLVPPSLRKVNHGLEVPAPRGFPPVWNTDAIRRSFPKQWSEYCKLTFKTAYGIQKAFPGIDSKTARAWINGDHGASGGFVAAVVAADPNAIKILGGME